ncbi:uncharacterized protein [Coffea arabica]|uniref:Uncharacterized protein n=1 Tax=Coffea arabica TaxID=13443 RepID=A0A6P6V0V0_COFAR|nr:uncharacterized protein LOC113716217 [Coffea arabica]
MAEFSSKKRVRVDSDETFEAGFDAPEVKRLREDLLGNFDDGEFYTASLELDSFMKSFEEEILSGTPTTTTTAVAVVDLTSSESGESQPDLGYLLEASDDELGLPPTTSEGQNGNEEDKAELVRVESDSSGLRGELWGYSEELPSYDSFDVGIGEFGDYIGGGGEYVALDGLFDYSDLGFGSTDFTWRPETLPAK